MNFASKQQRLNFLLPWKFPSVCTWIFSVLILEFWPVLASAPEHFRLHRSDDGGWGHSRLRSGSYLVDAGVVQEGEQRVAVGAGGGLVVHHGHLDAPRVPAHAQTDERGLDDGQQELEAQRAARTREDECRIGAAPADQSGGACTHPGILLMRSIVLMKRAATFLPRGRMWRACTFQLAGTQKILDQILSLWIYTSLGARTPRTVERTIIVCGVRVSWSVFGAATNIIVLLISDYFLQSVD